MDKNAIFSKLTKLLPDAKLEKKRFGRSDQLSIWIETKAITQIALVLRDQAELRLDWLENLSAMQLDDAIVLSYFVRSTTEDHTLILRASVVPTTAETEVDAPSVTEIWPMAEPMEKEIAEFFGVRFALAGKKNGRATPGSRLPTGWRGFPLRKKYSFPHEVDGLPRSRGGSS